MAGRFPSGSEFNINQDAIASKFTFENWPGEILFSGFEIGAAIRVGLPLIRNEEIQHSPVKDVFRIAIPMAAEDSAGRKSWDETAVMVAIKGAAPFYSLHYGTIKVSEDGSNTWSDTGKQQAYLVPELSPVTVEEKIQQWIMHQPVKSHK